MSRRERLLSAAVLALVLSLLLSGALSDGIVTDELFYIPAGYQHLFHRDFRLNPETPPVAKLLASLGLIGSGVVAPAEGPTYDPTGYWSRDFVFDLNAERPIVTRARLPVVALSLVLVAAIGAWARATHGPVSGWAALLLAGFHTSLLAHGHLATTDMPAAAATLGAMFAFWRWSLAPGSLRALVFGAALGLALCTRLTCGVLVPALAPFALARVWRLGARSAALRLGQLVGLAALSAVLTIWACYGFRYEPWPGTSVAAAVSSELGVPGAVVAALERLRALPEAWLEGVRWQLDHNRTGHNAFLLGRLSRYGFRHYFAVALAVKNTPGFLLAVSVAALSLWGARRRLSATSVELQWAAPAVALFVLVSLGHVHIGERYLLAAYPGMILLAASQLPRVLRWRAGVPLAVAAALLHIPPALAAARGGYLPYFNFLAGGREGGHRVLLDSNIDWGQDLPRLAAWMKENGVRRVQLGYQGSDDPSRYGIRWKELPGDHLNPPHQPGQFFAGVVAVSPNLLAGQPWFGRRENPYARLARYPPHDRAGVFFIYRFDLFPPGEEREGP